MTARPSALLPDLSNPTGTSVRPSRILLRGHEQSAGAWSLSPRSVYAADHVAGGDRAALVIPTNDCALMICQCT